jgi:hypothetical protein
VRDVHAEDAAGHVTHHADEVARLVVEDAHLVATRTPRHDQILLPIEHRRVEHRGRLRLELLHMILFIVGDIYFRNNVTVLFYIGFSTVQAVPFVSSGTLHGSNIKQLECIILSIAASEYSVAVVPDIDGIAAHMRAKDTRDGPLLPDIVDLHGVVPAAGEENVRVHLVELH